jgi:Thiamine monophosphate kinase
VEKEHHFIDKYLKPLSIKSETYPTGIGDDCAVIDPGER